MKLAELFVRFAMEGQDELNNGMDQVEQKGSKLAAGLGKAMQTVGKVTAVAVTAAATATGVMMKQSLDQYKNYEQLVGGAELLFGSGYDFIAQQAQNAFATVQMSQNEYLEQVNGFAVGLKTALGGNEQAAAELAHKIIQAEADVVAATGNSQEAVQNAFNGIMKGNYTMLDNLQLGIKPTKEGMQEVIDKMNDWNAAQGNVTDYTIESLADCEAAIVDYVEYVGMAGYAASEGASTIEGSLATTKAAWQNFLLAASDSTQDFDLAINSLVDSAVNTASMIGDKLIEILPNIVTGLTRLIEELIPKLPGIIQQLLPSLLNGAIQIVTMLAAELPSIISALIPVLLEAGATLVDAIGDVFGVSDLSEKIGEAFDGIVAKFNELSTFVSDTFAPVGERLSEIFYAIKDAAQPVIDTVSSLIDRFAEYVTSGEAGNDATNIFKEAIQGLADVVTVVIDALVSVSNWCIEHRTLLEDIAIVVGSITAAFVAYNAAVAIWTAVQTAANVVASAGAAAVGALATAWSVLTSPITLIIAAIGALIAIIVLCIKHWDEIKEVAEKCWEGIKNAWSKASDWFNSTIVQPIKNFFTNLWSSVSSAASAAWSAIQGVWSAVSGWFTAHIIDPIKNAFSSVWSAVSGTFDKIKTTIQEKIDAAREFVKGAIDKIKGFFNFHVELPHINLPHFSISPSGWKLGDLLKGSIPRLGIEWYAKGGILEDPTAFGLNGSNLMVGGEAGAEAVAPIETLQGYVSAAVAGQNAQLVDLLERILDALTDMRGDMGDNMRDALNGVALKVNNREFGRLVRGAVNA